MRLPMRTRMPPLAALLTIMINAACATTGATLGSGVGDSRLEAPPYVSGRSIPPGARVAHLPVTYQRGAVQPASFDPGDAPGSPVAALLTAMNAHLDGHGTTAGGVVAPPTGTPPDVQFGCERLMDDDCANGDERRPYRLAVGRASRGWMEGAARALDEAGADYLLVLTLEVGNYMPRQRNLRGDKEVPLGRGHVQSVRWLTALDRPVSVLQITGALVGPDGLAVRIAAHGLTARTTSIVAGGFGLQALITDDDVAHVLGATRDDLAGAPAVWQVALDTVISELTGRPLARY